MLTPNFINILADSCFLDASGAPLANGTVTITAVDATDTPVPFHIGGGGVSLIHSLTRFIAAGSMVGTLQLANPAAADVTVGYDIVVTDSATFETTTFSRVLIAPDSNGNFDLSTLQAGSYAQAVPVVYATGPQGPTGAAGPQGVAGPQGDAGPRGATGAQGVAGPQGVPGVAGPQGVPGVAGPQGAQGTTGPQGAPGTPGAAGTDGLSAYQLALLNGFSGTITQWLTSLVGAQGTPGTNGASGAAGTNGSNGAAATVAIGTVTTGATGSSAAVTNTGTSSAAVLSFTIPQGATGAPGTAGSAGPTGPTGAPGTPATPNTATAPLSITGNVISIPAATDTVDGFLAHTDHAAFSAKQTALTLTTTGSSGAATLVGATLNIPQYSAGGGSMVYPGAGIAVSTGTAWGSSLIAPAGTIVGTTDTQTLTNKTVNGVSPATMAFLDATSSVQTQINAKATTSLTPQLASANSFTAGQSIVQTGVTASSGFSTTNPGLSRVIQIYCDASVGNISVGTRQLTITTGFLSVGGNISSLGLAEPIATKTAAYTVTINDYTVLVNATSAAITVSLPASPSAGQLVNVKKIDATANVVTVSGNGKNIDTVSTQTISTQFAVFRLQYDGTQWWTL